jgi:hypothetical protein
MKNVWTTFALLTCNIAAGMAVSTVQKNHVIISGKETASIALGQTLLIKRSLKHPQFVVDIGTVKIAQIGEGYALAHILENGTEAGAALQPKSNEIRVGDQVLYPPAAIQPRLALLPTIEVSFYDLFVDPLPRARTLEVPPHKAKELVAQLEPIAKAHLAKILIEVHTDHQRNSSESEFESIQRASAIRQLIMRELNMDENRVIALGFGSSDPKVDKNHPQAAYMNRRVTIKAVD